LILHAVGLAFDDDGLSLVEQAVQNCGGDAGIVVEDGGSLLERLVGGDDEGTALVALADDLEEQVGAGFVEGQVAATVARAADSFCLRNIDFVLLCWLDLPLGARSRCF
jgi:hypothetical protein